MSTMTGDVVIVSSLLELYNGKMAHRNLDRYIVVADYFVMKHGFGMDEGVEGEVGIVF